METSGGSNGLTTRIKGSVRPIRNRVIVNNMEFGAQTVESESVLGWQSEMPANTLFGDKSGVGKSTVRPEDFGAN